ncbi:MAG: glutamyl-tRNA reductase [Oscillospiraceae bacterium]|nr:glutamyl-tRNA reductase [Oscillospiraceae bacterium]
MRIFAIGISHATAPIEVRSMLAFTKKQQKEILQYIKRNIAQECVILSTCNRCEFYLVGSDEVKERFLSYLYELVKADLRCYLNIYEDEKAVQHLAETAAGLDSMIIGEDQILGQVKDAHTLAAETGTAGIYMNTLFRIAVTGAKRVKTETILSKTPVSVATIAIKLCAQSLGDLAGKRIMIIGATGKIGSIVYKDLASIGTAKLFVTTRTRDAAIFMDFKNAEIIDYYTRYNVIDDMDAVISATACPHLTISQSECDKVLKTQKKRVFIDLAVPRDMDIRNSYLNTYIDIDDLRDLSEQNNAQKLAELRKARGILERYINEFLVWQVFYENKSLIDDIAANRNDSERESFMKMIYEKKANCSHEEFRRFIKKLGDSK